MVNKNLNRVALRLSGICVGNEENGTQTAQAGSYRPGESLLAFCKSLNEFGYTVSEDLLHSLAKVSDEDLAELSELIGEVLNVKLNWVPLVKAWEKPTGENLMDHLVTGFYNAILRLTEENQEFNIPGVTLPCGHLIPEGTFPIERYNGCPFCGTPFVTGKEIYKGQGSKLKELKLIKRKDLEQVFKELLASPVPLDATQLDSLKLLCNELELPAVEVRMKESKMVVISALIKKEDEENKKAGEENKESGEESPNEGKENPIDSNPKDFFSGPNEILRYLWFEKTGKAFIIKPKTLVGTAKKWQGMLPQGPYETSGDKNETADRMKEHLRLKYKRKDCRRIASWLNAVCEDPVKAAVEMHPYRGMWVRFIRALRLAEICKQPGYQNLAALMDVFYKQEYVTWTGELDHARQLDDRDRVLQMLSSRPGLFARSLFATMLRFGAEPTLESFHKVATKVPARLVLSLANAAETYFDIEATRYASPITGGKVPIAPNKLLSRYGKSELEAMVAAVGQLFEDVMSERFAARPTAHRTMYIDPRLFDVPVGVGDRATTAQDTSCALQGTRFPLEGDKVRLFMQWGAGLPAQQLDMDLSALILYDDHRDFCAYHKLTTVGATHSGDIRSVPEKVGTAEYIELDLPALTAAAARFVVFTCNAYSDGSLTPRLQVGWMNSANPMSISEENGVAYDPSCVQHLVRVADDNLAKGFTFGVLDVAAREITWLELPNQNQAAFQSDAKAVTDYLRRLRAKCSVGKLLSLKAQAQEMEIIDLEELADETYTYDWVLSPAGVNSLLS